MQHHQRSRNGPARQSRLEKRTAACESAAADDAENVAAVEATNEVVYPTVNIVGEVFDELCSNENYEKKLKILNKNFQNTSKLLIKTQRSQKMT